MSSEIRIRAFVNANNATAARQGKPGPKNITLVSVVTEAQVPNPNAWLFNAAQGAFNINLANATEAVAAAFPQGQEFELVFTPVDRATPSTTAEYAAEQARLAQPA